MAAQRQALTPRLDRLPTPRDPAGRVAIPEDEPFAAPIDSGPGAHTSWYEAEDFERNLGDVAHRDHGAWGIAYPSMESGQPARIGGHAHKSASSSSRSDYSHLMTEDVPAERLSVSTMDSDHDLEIARMSARGPVDLVSLQKTFGRDSDAVIRQAVPLQPWFRATQSLFQVIVGTSCIQVGFKEEDRICMATFCSLLIGCGFMKLLQASIGIFFIIRKVGIKGEEARAVLLMAEFVLWVSVLHAVVTVSCENLKLEAMASVYLLAVTVVWTINSVLWLGVFMKLEKMAADDDDGRPRDQSEPESDIILDTERSFEQHK